MFCLRPLLLQTVVDPSQEWHFPAVLGRHQSLEDGEEFPALQELHLTGLPAGRVLWGPRAGFPEGTSEQVPRGKQGRMGEEEPGCPSQTAQHLQRHQGAQE